MDYDFKEGFITDPGFLSTSINSQTAVGFGDGTTLVIKLAKGSKVMPVVNNGNHPGEGEIILPAFSILKIEKVLRLTTSQYILVEYVGNVMDSFFKMIADNMNEGTHKELKNSGWLNEAKESKPKDSNLNDPNTFNVDMKKIKDMIDNDVLVVKNIPVKKNKK